MGYKSKYKGSEIDSLLDKAKDDYEVKQYADYAGYNADTSRPSNTISLIQQDQSVVVGGKRYSQNSECYVGSDVSGISTTGNWFLCGEATFSQYTDVNIIGSVVNTLTGGMGGLFVLNLRSDGQQINPNYTFQWLCKVGSDAKTPVLRYVINGMTIKLYCKVFGGQYSRIHIRIFNQVNRAENAVHKEAFFKLKDSTTIIPEADMPSGTDIADVPYLLKTAAAAGSQKVLQTNATSSAERRVLLGENHETTQQDAVYKSANLTFNPNSKTLTVPTIKNPNGSWVHTAEGVAGQSGYVKIATIKINTALTDLPLTIQFTGRNYLQPAKLYIRFYNENNTDPSLASFYYESGSTRFGEYLHKSAPGTWDLYIKKGQSWDKIIILSCENPYAFLGSSPNYSITWHNELVTTLPTDYVESIMTTKRIHISGNAATATKATQDGNGVVIAGNYQRVYKSTFKVTTEGWYKLAYKNNYDTGMAWKDRYIVVSVANSQGGATSASFKILYNSQGGWLVNSNNDFMCMPLTGTDYACVTDVRLLSNTSAVSGKTYIEVYLRLAGTTTELSVDIQSNIPDAYLYNTATAGESDTSAYTVISRNARTATYGGSLAVGGLIAEKSLSANKLATSRKIGFANFNGTADVSLNDMQGKFQLRWTTNTTQWQRIIRFKTKTTYMRKHLILAVYELERSLFSGIIEVTLSTGFQVTATSAFVNWLSLWTAPNYDYKGMFKITATYPTDNDEYVYLDVYANSPYTHTTICFSVLSYLNTTELAIGNSGVWVEGSALQNVVYQSTTDTSLVPNQSLSATDSAFLQSLEGLCHKSNDSSLSLQRRTEYICGQQVLSDTEEAGKAFYGSSANPLVISVPLKDPDDAVAGGKVNVNIIRYYYAENYWQEVSYGVNTSYTYTRWVSNGTAWPWHRIMKEGVNIEYDAWVTKATNATNADVANKTKYPIVFKRNGASITNWFANTTFTIDIPEELLDYSAPTGITLKVPEISVANEAKKVSNDLEIRVNGKQKATFDGSSAKTVNIEASRSHFVKASMYGEGWTSPPAGATTPGVPLILDTSYMIPFGTLQDGDTIIMQVPNTLTSTSGYPVYLRLDTTQGNVAGNLVKIIKAQNAGNPVEWKGTTALTAGYYHFVYSEGAGGLIFMYRNVSTS